MSKTNCAHCGWDGDTDKVISKAGLEFCPACGNGVGLHHEQPTLRDQFAMAAFTGLLANSDLIGETEDYARWAYQHADAMLKEREK